MALSEKIQLLGKGLYKDIPDEITLKAIPTGSELDYVGAEDFDVTMLEKILPSCIEENINPKHLLEIDYYWVLRCLRILNYGPYIKVGTIFCDKCGTTSEGEYMVNITTVDCLPIPEGFTNSVIISKDEFLDFNKDIEIHLPTIQEVMNSRKDNQFKDAMGRTNRKLARICYMITSIGGAKLDPVSIRMTIQKELSSADYIILSERINQLVDYGLRIGGTTTCPKCKDPGAGFLSFIDERFFRPTMDLLRRWREDSNGRRDVENISGIKTR